MVKKISILNGFKNILRNGAVNFAYDQIDVFVQNYCNSETVTNVL